MPKYLVVYFSRTGQTEQVARALAEKLGADLEPIREARSRLGFFEYLRSARESRKGILPDIEPARHDPAAYDLVILGSPVWVSRPSTPIRAYLAANRQKLKAIACFVTFGGRGDTKTLAQLAEAAGKPPLATFSAKERQLKSGAWTEGLDRFAQEIRQAAT